eukprot:6178112-Pleurochrysis_carterae.AAC.4
MEFVGHNGYAAPRLKDAPLGHAEATAAWRQCAMLLQDIFQTCKLVHADFSEYNLLWCAASSRAHSS